MKYNVRLESCKRSCGLYQEFRNRHYVPNHGAIGQQLHYLIWLDSECVGIISGGSATYAVGCRDEYFGINKDNRQVALNGIIDNTVFRLERNIPNLATQILALWRRRIAEDWETRYDVRVCGFETFVIENERRKGSLYLADNWTFVGRTYGSTKYHQHGIEKQSARLDVEQKLVFCKWVKGAELPKEYTSSWKLGGQIRGQMSLFDFGWM